ncbi:helix-turn-helix transcriptional regulator [Nocardia wallacei]|uniref:helix-turn-helix transcriptional regulator n=1 Tax=Nocardia wallacei TaxID=480035 RepID=UPI0024571669|nr:helix-turn-helix domain-containing protein [Nocardia wallacei]
MNDLDVELTGFSSEDADQDERPSAWRGFVTGLQGEFNFHFPRQEAFTASSRVQRQGARVIGEFTSTRMRYDRTARNAAADGDPSLRLVLPLHGHIGLSAGGETVDLAPGEVGAFRMDFAMTMEYNTGMVAIMATVPDEVLPRRLAGKVPPNLGQRPMAAMLASHIQQLNALRESMTSLQFMQGTDLMYQMLRYALAEEEADARDDLLPIAMRARRYAWAYSDYSDYSVHSLAADCHCSLRQLHKSLGDIGPGELLRTIRLEKAWDRLRDPLYRNVHEVAMASGFKHLITFHQAFLGHFGITPGKVRENYSHRWRSGTGADA